MQRWAVRPSQTPRVEERRVEESLAEYARSGEIKMTQTVDIKKEAGTLEGKEAEEGIGRCWLSLSLSLSLSWFSFKAGFGHEEWAKRRKRGEAHTHTQLSFTR